MDRFRGLVLSTLPIITNTFYGREYELGEIRQALDPCQPGRKSLLLHGMGGSGKTQLSLQHILQDGQKYAAILWIDASTQEHAMMSFAEAAGIISSSWPPDLPTVYAGPDELLMVTARLRSTRYTNWLLVIDSIDNLKPDQLLRCMPSCEYGSILAMSTQYQARNGFTPGKLLAVDGLDLKSSRALLLAMAGHAEVGEDGK